MNRLQGIVVFPGVVFAPIVLDVPPLSLQNFSKNRSADEGTAQIQKNRLSKALTAASATLKEKLPQMTVFLGAGAEILQSRIALLEDEGLKQTLEAQLDAAPVTAEYAVSFTFADEIERIRSKKDGYLRSREEDFIQIRDQLLSVLEGNNALVERIPSEPYILVTEELSVDKISHLDPKRVCGIISESGSKTSHSAILLRALGIPSIFGANGAVRGLQRSKKVFLDAQHLYIDVDPSQENARLYEEKVRRYQDDLKELEIFKGRQAISRDGHLFSLCANISELSEIDGVKAQGVDGIGLFRTEFIFMDRDNAPSEEEQTRIYTALLRAFPESRVLIRTLDIGGDKPLPYLGLLPEDNPFLGLRAIRLCLKHPNIFETQLRALLRATPEGRGHLLFPMISSLEELRAAKKKIAALQAEFREKRIPICEKLPIGIMVETPAAVLMAPDLAKEVDFFSVGTNDLTQYLLAVDRTNRQVSHLYSHYHPAVLKALDAIMKAAREQHIWVSICGELGADPLMLPLLVGLGVDEISMSARFILPTKRQLSTITMPSAQALLHRVRALTTTQAIKAELECFLKSHGTH